MKTTDPDTSISKVQGRRHLALLALATLVATALATASLLSQFNVNAILYKGF